MHTCNRITAKVVKGCGNCGRYFNSEKKSTFNIAHFFSVGFYVCTKNEKIASYLFVGIIVFFP